LVRKIRRFVGPAAAGFPVASGLSFFAAGEHPTAKPMRHATERAICRRVNMVSTLERRSLRNEVCRVRFQIDFGADFEAPDPGPPHPESPTPSRGFPADSVT
jgi:hypothetical protein